jgi:hypothetical protein
MVSAGSRHQAPTDLTHATAPPAGYLRDRPFSSTGGGLQSHEQGIGTGFKSGWWLPLRDSAIRFLAIIPQHRQILLRGDDSIRRRCVVGKGTVRGQLGSRKSG